MPNFWNANKKLGRYERVACFIGGPLDGTQDVVDNTATIIYVQETGVQLHWHPNIWLGGLPNMMEPAKYILDPDDGNFYYRSTQPMAPTKRLTSADIDLFNERQLKLMCQYVPEFVDELKQQIPNNKREWRPKPDAFWLVDVSYLDILTKLCDKYYSSVRHLFASAHESDPYSFLFLYPEAPDELVKAAYKCLALLYHPDRTNGNSKRMSEVNSAYTAIKDAKGWK